MRTFQLGDAPNSRLTISQPEKSLVDQMLLVT